MYLGTEKNDRRQVNKKFRKFERKYRDRNKRKETRLGHRHVMLYQRNNMGTLTNLDTNVLAIMHCIS